MAITLMGKKLREYLKLKNIFMKAALKTINLMAMVYYSLKMAINLKEIFWMDSIMETESMKRNSKEHI